jgi:hypothetical protein
MNKKTFIFFKLLIPPIFLFIYNALSKKKKKNDLEAIDDSYLFSSCMKSGQNKVLHILGNSPTLSQLNINFIEGNDIFVCNHFYKFKEFEKIKTISNVYYFGFEPLKTFKKIAELDGTDLDVVMSNYFSCFLSEDYYSILPKEVFLYLKNNKKYSKYKILCYSVDAAKKLLTAKLFNKNIDKELIDNILKILQTPHGMLQIALLLGYNEIFLHGLQHSYVRDKLNQINYERHFYEEEEGKKTSFAHLDLAELFYDSFLTFTVYKNLAKLANLLEVKVYDCTKDGDLDMFEKKDV